MFELIELTGDEIEAVGGGALVNLPNVSLPNLNLVLSGNLNIGTLVPIAVGVLNNNTSISATALFGSLQNIGTVIS